MKHFVVGFVALSIAGCATDQEAENRRGAAAETMRQAAYGYCHSLMRHEALDPIRLKVVLFGDAQPTFDMLANADHVTAEERPAVREWAALGMRCQEQTRSYFQSYYTSMHVTIYNAATGSANALRAQLYNGQLTYGQYNQERQKVITDTKAAMVKLDAELARQDAEAQYRAQQIANQQWQNYLILQQTYQH